MPGKINKNRSMLAGALILSLLLFGCTGPRTAEREQNTGMASWGGSAASDQLAIYTNNALKKFGSNLVKVIPKDIEKYCPRYKSSGYQARLQFWAGLISSLAYFESKHSPDVSFKESFTDSQGNAVVSRGLLQISVESANLYGCGISKAKQLHDPETNIDCGVRILNRWVGVQDQVISDRKGWWLFKGSWRGAARYWSPFRNDSKRNAIASEMRKQPYCTGSKK